LSKKELSDNGGKSKDTKRTVDHHCRECDAWDEAIDDRRPLCDTCLENKNIVNKWMNK